MLKRVLVVSLNIFFVVSSFLAVFWNPLHESLHALGCSLLAMPYIKLENAVWVFGWLGKEIVEMFPYIFSLLFLFCGVSVAVIGEYLFNKKFSLLTVFLFISALLYALLIYLALLNEFQTNFLFKMLIAHLTGLI